MSTPPKTPKTPKGQREGTSYAHQNRSNLPRANAPSGLSKTHVRSDFYVASNPERVRQQREEQIAKQIRAERVFRPSPHKAYAPEKTARPKHKRPHIPPEELRGIAQRMEQFKQTRLGNEAAKPQTKSKSLEKMSRKAAFIARRKAQTTSKSKTQKR